MTDREAREYLQKFVVDDDYFAFGVSPLVSACEIAIEKFETCDRLQAENERLKGHQKDGFFNLLGNCLVFSKTLKDYNDMRKGLKAEAYKECIDKLLEKAISTRNYVEIKSLATTILNELVGEDNA